MAVYGYSTGTPGAASMAETVADQTMAIETIIDRLMWLRRRLAMNIEAVEPDDIRSEDRLRNTEREA